jgi:hypothetical protein
MVNLNLRTLKENEEFNPIRNLWRNVLIAAIEDLVKATKVLVNANTFIVTDKYKHYYSHAQKTELEYFTIPNQDFYDVCQFAEIDHTQVRKNVIKRVKQIQLKEGKNGKSYMPGLQGQWLHQNSI